MESLSLSLLIKRVLIKRVLIKKKVYCILTTYSDAAFTICVFVLNDKSDEIVEFLFGFVIGSREDVFMRKLLQRRDQHHERIRQHAVDVLP